MWLIFTLQWIKWQTMCLFFYSYPAMCLFSIDLKDGICLALCLFFPHFEGTVLIIMCISLCGAPGDIQCKHWPNMEAVFKKGKTLDVYVAKTPLIGTLFRLNYPAICSKQINSIIWVETLLVLQVIWWWKQEHTVG